MEGQGLQSGFRRKLIQWLVEWRTEHELYPVLPTPIPKPLPGRSVWWQRIRTVDKLEPDERWWIRGWRKMREWSELVAGPRWKTFIRRCGRNHCCGGNSGGGCGASPNRSDHGKFRYDPLSYSLNFDDGKQTGYFEDEFPYRDYSMRFAAPSLPVSTNCLIDSDSDSDAPPLRK